MREFFTNIELEEPPLVIVSTLAIISILMHLLFPQHTIIAKIKKDVKPTINQEDSLILEGPIFIKQENEPENKTIILEDPTQESRVLAVQTENKSSEKSTKDSEIKEVETTKVKNRKLVLVTAYSSTVDQCDSTPFITANGTHVHDGTIAANFLKFGTRVKFPSLYGDKIFIVEDRMKSNYKVDIWFPTRQEAKNFGAKRVEIEILD
ncbi:MAG: hypothetical protein U9P70_04085 [Patescibacteria group bacterium]|nr:hypothetical protein [Patescibacteria group bacterium]